MSANRDIHFYKKEKEKGAAGSTWHKRSEASIRKEDREEKREAGYYEDKHPWKTGRAQELWEQIDDDPEGETEDA